MSKDQETTRKYGYALLAGGAGKRMGGSNKAALMHDGVTFLERISSEMDKTRSACYISMHICRDDDAVCWKTAHGTTAV